jgi:nucleoside-diphosphate-sugar epimerase
MVEEAMSPDGSDARLLELARGATAILNLAGRAHLHGGYEDLMDLHRSNVELPLRLLEVASKAGVPLVHVSSTKAEQRSEKMSVYAQSKAEAEQALADAVSGGGSAPVVAFRTCAVMAPPYDAGKLSLLRKVRWVPRVLVPNRRVPVVSPERLAELLQRAVEIAPTAPFTVFDMPRDAWMSLRDVMSRLRAQG